MTRPERMLARALAGAARARGQTSPNPMVGAVLARGDEVLAEAWHHRAGEAHAEPQVLESLRAGTSTETVDSDDDLTLYVNLEPCNHRGRTPPCTEAILASPVRWVVVSTRDPDPRVSGQGIERLRQAGVRVEVGCLAEAARELNHVYWGRQLRGRPFVVLKVARSADGSIAAADGEPVRITGSEAERHTHELRAGVDAILVGVGTLERDRPRLDCRLASKPERAPRRVILDPRLRFETAWLRPGREKPLLVCLASVLLSLPAAHRRQLDPVVDLVGLPGSPEALELQALPEALAERGLWSVLVEGGGETHRRFLEAGLWDRMVVYENASLYLDGMPWAAASAWEGQTRAMRLRTETLGADVCRVFVHPGAWEMPAQPATPDAGGSR